MVETTLGLSVLKVTVAAALGLFAVRLAARRAAAVRHAVLLMTFVALAAIPIVAAVAPPYFIRVEYRHVAEWRHSLARRSHGSSEPDVLAPE